MNNLFAKLEMPLLLRELKILAANRRTYIIRFIYAATIFSVACGVFFGGLFGSSSGGLGSGRVMFGLLITAQFWAMVILIPATTASAITIEKERDALGVLMLTTLGSFRIVLQKLISRLVPMFSFLLLGLPLLAVAYSYGGVTDDLLTIGIGTLFLNAAVLGTISILCSCWSAGTTQALLQSWVLFAVLFFLIPPMWAPNAIVEDNAVGSPIVLTTMLNVGATIMAFFLSSALLSNRAFASSQNYLLKMFQALDRFFNSANDITGGVVLVRDQNESPKMNPVAWRETARKSLGTFRYQFRVLTVLEIPILFVCQIARLDSRGAAPAQVLLYFAWGITLLLVTVHGASLVSSERSRQTLNVLLSTPMRGVTIITEKWAGLRRLLFVMLVPFLTIFLFRMWLDLRAGWVYGLVSCLMYAFVMHAAAWIAIWIGLHLKTQTRAILTSLMVLAILMAAPLGLRLLLSSHAPMVARMSFAVSAVDILLFLEENGDPQIAEAWLSITGFLITWLCLGVGMRSLCRWQIDEKLGRVPAGFKMRRTEPPTI